MTARKWILICTPLILIGSFILFAVLSERAAESRARSFCAHFKTGDDFSSALRLMRSTEASDKWVNKDNHMAIQFSGLDPQSAHACEIDSKDGKISNLRYKYLDGN